MKHAAAGQLDDVGLGRLAALGLGNWEQMRWQRQRQQQEQRSDHAAGTRCAVRGSQDQDSTRAQDGDGRCTKKNNVQMQMDEEDALSGALAALLPDSHVRDPDLQPPLPARAPAPTTKSTRGPAARPITRPHCPSPCHRPAIAHRRHSQSSATLATHWPCFTRCCCKRPPAPPTGLPLPAWGWRGRFDDPTTQIRPSTHQPPTTPPSPMPSSLPSPKQTTPRQNTLLLFRRRALRLTTAVCAAPDVTAIHWPAASASQRIAPAALMRCHSKTVAHADRHVKEPKYRVPHPSLWSIVTAAIPLHLRLQT